VKSSEKELWAAVIDRALMDATESCGQSLSARMDRDRAREWLTTPSRDLDEVCALAGVESCRVIATATAKIAAAKMRANDALSMPKARRSRGPLYTHDGRSLTLTEWSAEIGIQHHTLYRRIRNGYSIERALTQPLRGLDRGVVGNFAEQRPDRSFPTAQESTELEISQ